MRTLSLIALSLLACQKEPAPPPSAPPPPAPNEAQQVDVVGEPVVFAPLTPSAICTYELKEVATEAVGDQLLAGHDLTVTYELRSKQTEAPIAFEAEVTRVQADARRETYNAKLDSLRAGDMLRVQGGADTLVMYEMVLPFAFVGKKLTIELDERGRLRALQGGDAVRQALMEMHPSKPRKQTHYREKAAVALSDEAIVFWLLPSAVAIPKEGPFASGRQESESDVIFDLIEYVGRGSEGYRISVRPDRWLLEHKQLFLPVKEVASKVPPLELPAYTVELLRGERALTVEFEPKNPCPKRAGSAFNDAAAWTGMIDEVKTSAERKRSTTRIWTKK